MAFDLVPNRFWNLPRVTPLWDDEDNWFSSLPQNTNGLSVSEDEQNVYVEAAVAGLEPKDIDITFHNGVLWVKGQKKTEEKEKNRKYYTQSMTQYSYRITVPGDIDESLEPEAEYDKGVMKITFKKSPKSQPKKIAIKASGK